MSKFTAATLITFLAGLSLSAAAGPGLGGRAMYKTVGADGKVTFSDRPAIESAAELSVLRSNTLVPIKAAVTPAGSGSAAVKPAVAATGTMTPQIEKTVADVMVRAEFPRRVYPLCNTSQAAARAFTQAASGWKERNLAATDHQRRILMQVVSPAKRDEIEGQVAQHLSAEVARVSARPAAERARWCAEAVATLANPGSDIDEPAMMGVAIVPYKAR